jgi:hypothetical protein
MKKVKLNGKLCLSKTKMANLSNANMNKVAGGSGVCAATMVNDEDTINLCTGTNFTISCACPTAGCGTLNTCNTCYYD